MASSEELKHPKHEEEESTGVAGEDEDTGAQVDPIIRLQEVAVTTGEENENVLLDLKAKLYRFDQEGNQWKERGVGTVKLLKHKDTQKVRLVMRQSKTLKICANHLVLPSISILEHAGNDKSCVWHATDFSDGELKEEIFSIRFASVENRKTFKEMIVEVAESQSAESQVAEESQESKEATSAANLLENLSVKESKDQEENTKEATPISSEEKNDNEKCEDPKADK